MMVHTVFPWDPERTMVVLDCQYGFGREAAPCEVSAPAAVTQACCWRREDNHHWAALDPTRLRDAGAKEAWDAGKRRKLSGAAL